MDGAQAYSTLELDLRQPESGLEVHHGHVTNSGDTESHYLQPVSDMHQKPDEHRYDQPLPQQQYDSTTKTWRKSTLCGLPRRVFNIILAVSLVILIGAIAGGVAGGLRSRRQKTTTANENLTSCILSTSNLAAANRTINGVNQRKVFFQDYYGALIVGSFKETSTKWTITNLTDQFASPDDPKTHPISILPGASMSAVACQDEYCGETRLFYLAADNTIRDTKHGDVDGRDVWDSGGTIWGKLISASPNSQLAATFRQIASSTGPVEVTRTIAYQGLNGQIYVTNDTDKYDTLQRLDGIIEVTANTDLAMVMQFGGEALDQISLVARNPEDSSMIEAKYDAKANAWSKTKSSILDIAPQPKESSSIATQQFAVTMRNNWLDSVYLALNYDGTITGRIVGQNNEMLNNITLETSGGEVAKFSAIATTFDGHLYGIANNSIREYSFDASDPSVLHLNGIVYNGTDCA